MEFHDAFFVFAAPLFIEYIYFLYIPGLFHVILSLLSIFLFMFKETIIISFYT